MGLDSTAHNSSVASLSISVSATTCLLIGRGNLFASPAKDLLADKDEATQPIVDLLTADQLSLRTAVNSLLTKLRAGRVSNQEEADGADLPAEDHERSDVLASWNLAQMKFNQIREHLMRRES